MILLDNFFSSEYSSPVVTFTLKHCENSDLDYIQRNSTVAPNTTHDNRKA